MPVAGVVSVRAASVHAHYTETGHFELIWTYFAVVQGGRGRKDKLKARQPRARLVAPIVFGTDPNLFDLPITRAASSRFGTTMG